LKVFAEVNIQITKERSIGKRFPCYIIMDIAANYNGDFNKVKELIIAAAKNGADAVKFQTYTAINLYSTKTSSFSNHQIDLLSC